MATVVKTNGAFSVRAYRGDAKTLLAFNLPRPGAKNLAGFTMQVSPSGRPPTTSRTRCSSSARGSRAGRQAAGPTRASTRRSTSSAGCTCPARPPGHEAVLRQYTLHRHAALLRRERIAAAARSGARRRGRRRRRAVRKKQGLELGFTRGFTQSQAFVHHFGLKAAIRPKGTTCCSTRAPRRATNADGDHYTFADRVRVARLYRPRAHLRAARRGHRPTRRCRSTCSPTT